MADAMAIYEEGSRDIAIARDPVVVLEEAKRAAKALKDVISKKEKKVMMNGEQYLEFEDWQTVARFYGATVKVLSTEFIDYGASKGFLARASVIRQDGQEISAAEAMCMNDEEKWSTRSKYEWSGPKDNRVKNKVGEEQVPLFQLRSMAQTRACAKALRNVFAWVVVLAGYAPAPAEDMTGTEEKATTKAPQEKKAEDGGKTDDEKRGEIIDLCAVYAAAKSITVEVAMKEFTVFKGKDGEEKYQTDPKALSAKWLNSTLGRARELAKPFMPKDGAAA
jgi:hypothetical protein